MKVFEKFKDKVVKYHQSLRKKRLERLSKKENVIPPIWRGCAARRGWILMEETIDGRQIPKISIDKMAYDYNNLIDEISKISNRISEMNNNEQDSDGLHG